MNHLPIYHGSEAARRTHRRRQRGGCTEGGARRRLRRPRHRRRPGPGAGDAGGVRAAGNRAVRARLRRVADLARAAIVIVDTGDRREDARSRPPHAERGFRSMSSTPRRCPPSSCRRSSTATPRDRRRLQRRCGAGSGAAGAGGDRGHAADQPRPLGLLRRAVPRGGQGRAAPRSAADGASGSASSRDRWRRRCSPATSWVPPSRCCR